MYPGLVEKFKIKRNDKPYPTFSGVHFVLTPRSDPAAREALLTYARAIEADDPRSALGIRTWLKDIELTDAAVECDAAIEAVEKFQRSQKL